MSSTVVSSLYVVCSDAAGIAGETKKLLKAKAFQHRVQRNYNFLHPFHKMDGSNLSMPLETTLVLLEKSKIQLSQKFYRMPSDTVTPLKVACLGINLLFHICRRQGIFKETTDHLYNAATQERETTLNQLLIEVELCICRIPAMKFT
ncbi:uncharacterized protein LOC108460184 isoform X1 [Gossypium arboreum]|uniref:uncharacterized protein LOC108460184 isoform X1 n=1 Tax=Gossypium arboreum TaxID=29729 RepID=UPI0022F19C76|nr:uncharacterized protein LOC108460184 isoform X1 [Gossypium arboreum]